MAGVKLNLKNSGITKKSILECATGPDTGSVILWKEV